MANGLRELLGEYRTCTSLVKLYNKTSDDTEHSGIGV